MQCQLSFRDGLTIKYQITQVIRNKSMVTLTIMRLATMPNAMHKIEISIFFLLSNEHFFDYL